MWRVVEGMNGHVVWIVEGVKIDLHRMGQRLRQRVRAYLQVRCVMAGEVSTGSNMH